ncbi:MAG: membrane protein [Saprospiraceae bacterium]|nr:MAG: membrane protein [Saprospiraceae bacterium]
MASCTDFLAEEPRNLISSVNFYKNEADAKAAIAGAYSSLGNEYYGNWEYYAFNVLHSGAADGRGSQGPISIYNQVLDQRNIDRAGGIWGRIYSAINRANAVLDNVPDIEDMDQGLKTQILAEARFLRALAYFELVRGWGPVPLRLTETKGLDGVAAPRAPENEVYSQIIEDATAAEKDLPDVQDDGTGRASKWAAKMLLAQVYLTREQWAEARDLADEVINSSLFSLVLVDEPDDFYQIFREKTHTEDIMSRQHSETTQSEIPNFLHITNVPVYNPSGSGFFAWLPIQNSFIGDSWDDDDLRKSFNLYTEYVDASGATVSLPPTTPILFKKFIDDTNGQQTFSVPLFRYTEAFLIYAEAASQAEGGPSATALERLNTIKRRGYGYDPFSVSPVDYPAGMNQQDFRDAVLKERDYEFLLERRRWWDLKRTNRVIEYFSSIGRTFLTERLLWPLPENEINTNPALGPGDQNPGY